MLVNNTKQPTIFQPNLLQLFSTSITWRGLLNSFQLPSGYIFRCSPHAFKMPLSVGDLQQQLADQQLVELQVQQHQVQLDQAAKAQEKFDNVSIINIIDSCLCLMI